MPAYRHRMRRTALLLAVLALAFAACGDDDDEEVSAASTTTTAAAGTTTTGAGGGATTETTGGAPDGSRCGTVGFTPNSEDAASDITATGLSCDEARAFVEVAGTRTSAGGPQQVTVDGYRCVATHTERDPLPQALYECENGDRRVTFVRS